MTATTLTRYQRVPFATYGDRLTVATGALGDRVASLSTHDELEAAPARWYVSPTGRTGFGVTLDGELIGLFSTERGGRAACEAALTMGARWLSCFDGGLRETYERYGFVTTGREDNWTPGEPDVLTMTHESTMILT